MHITIESIVILLITSLSSSSNVCNKNGRSLTIDITNGEKSGTTIIQNGINYHQNEYFTDGDRIKGCVCDIGACVRKCCPNFQILIRGNAQTECVNSPMNGSLQDHMHISPENIIHGKECVNKTAILAKPNLESDLKNGVLHVYDMDFTFRDFCLDYLDDDLIAIVCVDPDPEATVIHSVGMMISMPFLLATFLVYAILPDHNIHKKALMYYVMSLFMAYVFLVCIQLPTTEYSEASCTSLGVFCIFFFLLSFFWMNVICVDMFLGFRGFRGFSGNKSSEKKRFIWYNVYAWGMSLTITIVIIIINQAGNPDKWFHPNLGIGQCYIRDGLPLLIYFYMPMGLLITVNLALFIFTALKIRQVKKETKVLRKGDSKRHSDDNDKQKFNLYLKLLFAMGVNWSMEIVSWAVSYKYQQSIPSYVWYLTDFCNASYGVFIFFIFVFKKSVWKQLQRRYYAFRGKQHLAHSMTTTNQTASSAVDTNRNSDDQEMALSSTR